MGLSRQWNGDVALASLNQAPTFPELYYPLWWYSGSFTRLGYGGQEDNSFIAKGVTGSGANISMNLSPSSMNELFTLNSNWPSGTTFALEYCGRLAAGTSATFQLYDATTNSAVANSQQTFMGTSGIFNVVRSGKLTLTPGHTYGIQFVSYVGSTSLDITDISLIIFPPSPTTSPFDLASISLANPNGNTLKEAYIPLWVYSVGTSSNSGASAGADFIPKGSTVAGNNVGSAGSLITLSSTWSSSQKFALEVSMEAHASGFSANIGLYDMTLGSLVNNSSISTGSTSPTLMRSGSFTLVTGHSFGLTVWGTTAAQITKAHLVALAS